MSGKAEKELKTQSQEEMTLTNTLMRVNLMNRQDYRNVIEFELDQTLHCTCVKITTVIPRTVRNEVGIQLSSNCRDGRLRKSM